MGLWDVMARRANASADKLYQTLYEQSWTRRPALGPGARHALADEMARRGSSSLVPDFQLDDYEARALTRTAAALGEHAGFAYLQRVLCELWEAECDAHFAEVIKDCRRLTSNPLTIAAWTLRWCAAQADTRIRLIRTPIGDAAHPSLVQASAASLGAELAVSAEHAIVAAAQLTVTTDDRIDQLITWARGAAQSQV